VLSVTTTYTSLGSYPLILYCSRCRKISVGSKNWDPYPCMAHLQFFSPFSWVDCPSEIINHNLGYLLRSHVGEKPCYYSLVLYVAKFTY